MTAVAEAVDLVSATTSVNVVDTDGVADVLAIVADVFADGLRVTTVEVNMTEPVEVDVALTTFTTGAGACSTESALGGPGTV